MWQYPMSNNPVLFIKLGLTDGITRLEIFHYLSFDVSVMTIDPKTNFWTLLYISLTIFAFS